jgi:hypothetical protein
VLELPLDVDDGEDITRTVDSIDHVSSVPLVVDVNTDAEYNR